MATLNSTDFFFEQLYKQVKFKNDWQTANMTSFDSKAVIQIISCIDFLDAKFKPAKNVLGYIFR